MIMDKLLQVSATLSALLAVIAFCAEAVRWFDRQKKQDKEIDKLKRENMLVVFALSACLDGLTQLGANHTVTQAKKELDEYILASAHSQTGVIK